MSRSNTVDKRLSLPFAYAREESRPRNFILVLILFLVAAACMVGITTALGQLVYRWINEDVHPITAELDRLNLSNAMELVLILLTCLYVRLFERRKLHSMGFIARFWFPKYLWGLLLGFLLFTIVAGISCLALGGSLTIHYEYFPYWPVFALTGACLLIQGLAEEVLCRGYLLTSLGRRYSLGFSAILSGLVFSALHAFNPGTSGLAYVNIFLMGIFLSQVFYHTQSIWTAAALHSMWNFAQGTIYGFRVSGISFSPSLATLNLGTGSGPLHPGTVLTDAQLNAIWTGGDFGPEASISCTLVLIVMIIIEAALIHHRFRAAGVREQAASVDMPSLSSASQSATTPQEN